MQNRTLLTLIAMALMTLSCSPTQLLNGVNGSEGSGQEKLDPDSCPTAFIVDYYSLNLAVRTPIPAKLAVVLDGETKFDECNDRPEVNPPPVVAIYRFQTKMEVSVQPFVDKEPLPTIVDFKLLDRGDCTGAPSTFYSATQLPLNFKKHYYDPTRFNCGSYMKADVDLAQ